MRRPSYYIFSMFMPLGLITALAFVQFSTGITDKDWFSRVDHSVTLLLTAAAYTSAVASSLPEIGYATLLDKYLLSCMLLLALFVVENPLVRFVATIGDGDNESFDAVMLDRTITIVLGGVWLALHIITAIRAWSAQIHARQRLTEEGLQKQTQKGFKSRRESMQSRLSAMWMPQAVMDGEKGLRVARREGAIGNHTRNGVFGLPKRLATSTQRRNAGGTTSTSESETLAKTKVHKNGATASQQQAAGATHVDNPCSA